MDVVYITWLDAVSFDPWENVDEHAKMKPPEIHSVGFLISKDKQKITLALNVDPAHSNVSQTITIPIKMVKSIRKVKTVK